MTLDELKTACADARARRAALDLDPDEAHVVLAIPGSAGRSMPGRRMRLAPGLYGQIVGDTDTHVIIDVAVADLERWIERVTT